MIDNLIALVECVISFAASVAVYLCLAVVVVRAWPHIKEAYAAILEWVHRWAPRAKKKVKVEESK